jgi:MFS family permease
MIPMIRSEFNLDYTQSGLVLSAFSLAYGIGQLPAGWLADRIGRRLMITVGILGVALCGLVVGLSHTYIMMMVFLAAMGLMGGGYHPSASPVVSETVAPENRASALGFHLIGGSASYFLAPLIAVAIAAALGWRSSYIILAIPAIIFGVLFYIAMGRMPRLTAAVQKTNRVDTNSQAADPPGRIRRLVAFIILTAFTGSMVMSSISFLPLFLVDHFGAAKEAGGIFMAVFSSAGIWSSTLGGFLADRFGQLKIVLIACFGLGLLLYFLNLAPFGVGTGALMLIMGAFSYFRMPVSEAFIIHNTSPKNRSTILGIYFFTSMEGSGVITPLLGYSIDNIGFTSTYTIAATAILAVATICYLFLRGNPEK